MSALSDALEMFRLAAGDFCAAMAEEGNAEEMALIQRKLRSEMAHLEIEMSAATKRLAPKPVVALRPTLSNDEMARVAKANGMGPKEILHRFGVVLDSAGTVKRPPMKPVGHLTLKDLGL